MYSLYWVLKKQHVFIFFFFFQAQEANVFDEVKISPETPISNESSITGCQASDLVIFSACYFFCSIERPSYFWSSYKNLIWYTVEQKKILIIKFIPFMREDIGNWYINTCIVLIYYLNELSTSFGDLDYSRVNIFSKEFLAWFISFCSMLYYIKKILELARITFVEGLF